MFVNFYLQVDHRYGFKPAQVFIIGPGVMPTIFDKQRGCSELMKMFLSVQAGSFWMRIDKIFNNFFDGIGVSEASNRFLINNMIYHHLVYRFVLGYNKQKPDL